MKANIIFEYDEVSMRARFINKKFYNLPSSTKKNTVYSIGADSRIEMSIFGMGKSYFFSNYSTSVAILRIKEINVTTSIREFSGFELDSRSEIFLYKAQQRISEILAKYYTPPVEVPPNIVFRNSSKYFVL